MPKRRSAPALLFGSACSGFTGCRQGRWNRRCPVGTRVVLQKRPLAVGAIVVYYPPESFEMEECGPKPHMVDPGGAACDTPVAKASGIKAIKRVVAGPGDEIYDDARN